jgi:4-diphosphocytidyl-2-C-methyl-D-erythritol kinase
VTGLPGSSPTLRLEAFAKVNRSLVVLGRRPDGFHELETLFETVDLADRLTFDSAPGLELVCDDPSVPVGEENLVFRAALLLARQAGMAPRARITLEKRIPAGGGLGGGSSDAASTLLGLNLLWGLDLPPARLALLAAELGSDVPFFLVGGRARGTGRGERVQPLPDVPPVPLLLVFPPFGMPTPAVFEALGAPGLTGAGGGDIFTGPVPGVFPDRNDLEPAAESLRPELASLRRALSRSGAETARLSGSGSTLFGVFRDLEGARQAGDSLADLPPGSRTAVVVTVPRREFALRALPAGTVPAGGSEQRS